MTPLEALPRFAAPAEDPLGPGWTTEPAGDGAGGERPGPEQPSTPRRLDRTRVSTPAEPGQLAEVVAGLFGLAFLAVSWAVRRTRRRRLRPPTEDELHGVAGPLAAILGRHSPAAQIESTVAKDLVDAAAAAGAVAAYLQSDPVQPLDLDYLTGPADDLPPQETG
jgi:hypothetical protein